MTDRTYGLPRRTNAEIIASHEAQATELESYLRDNPEAHVWIGRHGCPALEYVQHLRVMIELLRQDELEKFVDK